MLYKKLNTKLIKFIIVCICLFLFYYLIPFTGDDWAWGSSTGINRLNRWFKDYNGRYLGNCLVIIMTRYRIIRSILMMLTTLFIHKILSNMYSGIITNGIIFLMIFTIPRMIFRQTFAWVSGFSNYVIPLVFVLALFYRVKVDLKDDNTLKQSDIRSCIWSLILGISGCLFIENLSLYFVSILIIVNFYIIIKIKKINYKYLTYLLGAVIGNIIMFSNSAYTKINLGNSYRTIGHGTDIINMAYKNCLNYMSKYFVMSNILLNVCIAILVVFIIRTLKSESIKYDKTLSVYGILIFLCSAASIISKWFTDKINLLVTIVFLISIIGFSIKIFKDRMNDIIFLSFILISIVLITAPLLVVSPINARCFIFSYFMFIIYLFELVEYAVKIDAFAFNINKVKYLIACGTSVIIFLYFLMYSTIFISECSRVTNIQRQVSTQKKVIEIEHLSFEQFLWMPTPDNKWRKSEKWERHLKEFYGIDKKCDLKIKSK